VPLYIEIVHPPIVHHTFIDSYWAIWLPAGASAFNVILVKRFFDNLPREIFEAARIDGAGPFRLFYKIVLPMSRPILGVVSVFAVLASWKDFLWPLLVLTDPNKQPLSVRLPTIQSQTELGVFLAAMFIACFVPISGFLIFQRPFLRGTGPGGAGNGSVSTTTAASPSATSGRRVPGSGGSNARSGPAAGGAVGKVASVSTSSFALSTSAGQKVTVNTPASTTYRKGTRSSSASAV